MRPPEVVEVTVSGGPGKAAASRLES